MTAHIGYVLPFIAAGDRTYVARCRNCRWTGTNTTDRDRAEQEASWHQSAERASVVPVEISEQPIVIEATNTTQGGRPVVRVDGDLYVVQELHRVIHRSENSASVVNAFTPSQSDTNPTRRDHP